MSVSVENKIEELRTQIKEHNYNYYVLNKPTIPDPDYDKLLLELESLENQNPQLIIPDSPTQRVGSDLTDQSNLIKHKFPMLSIQNEKDLFKFDSRIRKKLRSTDAVEYIVEAKIDGTSISLEYVNGELIKAATRGDGEFGEDVTQNIKTISSVPRRLFIDSIGSYKLDNIIVRGEVFIYINDFKKMQQEQLEKGEKVFENPRNSAAGILKTKDSKIVAKRPLNVFAYSLLSIYEEFETIEENLSILKKMGFVVNNFAKKCKGIEEVIDACLGLEKQRNILPYEIDGAVIKVNSIKTHNALPIRPKSPFWAAAFKFNPMQESTIINGITWQVGRTGAITPVAELEPVKLAGSTISRATLHNFDEIQRLDIRFGDRVIIEKGGDVIPKVVRVDKTSEANRSAKTEPPEKCPVCNKKLKKLKDEVGYYCKNSQCPGQLKNQLKHFVSKDALDIKGIGEQVANKLIENNYIDTLLDLYKLNIDTLSSLNLGSDEVVRNLGQKISTKIFQALELSKNKPLSKWLFAIGIPKLGKTGAQAIAQNHNSFDAISNSQILKDILEINSLTEKAVMSNPRSKTNKNKVDIEKKILGKDFNLLVDKINDVGHRLVKSGWYQNKSKKSKNPSIKLTPVYTLVPNKGVGFESAKAVLDFFNSNFGIEFIKSIKKLGISPSGKHTQGNILEGSLFILTGTLPNYTREQVSEIIEKNGGKVTTSFSKQANYILAGEKAGSKLDKAKEAGIKIISESEFVNMIKEPNKNLESTSKKSKPEQIDMF